MEKKLLVLGEGQTQRLLGESIQEWTKKNLWKTDSL